jgi:hypothetical protein
MPTEPSGTLRFSVESLLYYAPQISRIGQQLASAEATAQQQLLGLGSFWGGSWPDQAFANAYPPAQYAALIMVQRLATQIEGIAGGVELMAHNYGVTEDTNTQDIERIGANQADTNDMITANGGIGSPPSASMSLPLLSENGPHPTPQANQSPAAPGSSPSASPTPSATHTASASPSPTPTGPATPSPTPGAAAPTSWQVSGSTQFLGPWPSGNPSLMDQASGYWDTLMNELEDAWAGLQRITDYIMADAEGAAATAFYNYVNGMTNPSSGSLTRAIEVCQYLRQTCTTEATNINTVKRAIELEVAEFVATLVITEVVSLITFQTAQFLGAAVEAGLLDWLTSTVASFAIDAAVLSKDLDTASEIVLRVIGSIASTLNDTVAPVAAKVAGAAAGGAFSGTAISIQNLAIQNAIGEAFGQQPTTGTAALKDILNGSWEDALSGSNATGGALNESAGILSKNVIKLGEQSGSKALVQVGLQLKSGSITVAAANQAIIRLIDPSSESNLQAVSNAVSNRLGTAIGPNTGSHAGTAFPGPKP